MISLLTSFLHFIESIKLINSHYCQSGINTPTAHAHLRFCGDAGHEGASRRDPGGDWHYSLLHGAPRTHDPLDAEQMLECLPISVPRRKRRQVNEFVRHKKF